LNEKNKKEKHHGSRSPIVVISISALLVIMLFCIFLAIRHSDEENGIKKGGKKSSSPSHPDREQINELDSGISVTDPVCGKEVDPADAPYHYNYAGKTFYFCSEECLKKFIDEPLHYSGAKVKVKITVKGSPPYEETPGEVLPEYPEGFETPEPDIIPGSTKFPPPIEVLPDATGSPSLPGEGEKETHTPPGDSYQEKKSETPDETPTTEETPDIQPKPVEKSPTPQKEPELKSTPIKPPSEGVETL